MHRTININKYIVLLNILFLLPLFILTGCDSTVPSVPVTEAWRQPLTDPTLYTVQSGDTLYSIAWNYGLDYRQIAALNGISPYYKIQAGQKLKLLPPNATSTALPKPIKVTTQAPQSAKVVKICPLPPPSAPVNTNTPLPQVVTGATAMNAGIVWMWPARGRVIDNYTEGGLNKGIDILGAGGSPVIAAAAGKVVYSGSGLRGYGNLVIIKHNSDFLSAYAHNQTILVQDGQIVKAGQVIALMGNTEARQVELHFEIRKSGKPVDPMKYLPGRC